MHTLLLIITFGFSSLNVSDRNDRGSNGYGHAGNFGAAPEIDPSSGASGLMLLGSVVLMIRGTRAKE